jgi:hypothetical protein
LGIVAGALSRPPSFTAARLAAKPRSGFAESACSNAAMIEPAARPGSAGWLAAADDGWEGSFRPEHPLASVTAATVPTASGPDPNEKANDSSP